MRAQTNYALQLNIVYIRGFEPSMIHADPQSGLHALKGQLSGVHIAVRGAGGVDSKVGIEIKSIKELYHSIKISLPWKVPTVLVLNSCY